LISSSFSSTSIFFDFPFTFIHLNNFFTMIHESWSRTLCIHHHHPNSTSAFSFCNFPRQKTGTFINRSKFYFISGIWILNSTVVLNRFVVWWIIENADYKVKCKKCRLIIMSIRRKVRCGECRREVALRRRSRWKYSITKSFLLHLLPFHLFSESLTRSKQSVLELHTYVCVYMHNNPN
jgi:hypothetical protein